MIAVRAIKQAIVPRVMSAMTKESAIWRRRFRIYETEIEGTTAMHVNDDVTMAYKKEFKGPKHVVH